MFKHAYLNDPVKRTAEMDAEVFAKYSRMNQENLSTSPEIVDEIKQQFFTYAGSISVEKAKVSKIWDFVEPKICDNPGLASFTLDYNGAKSSFFFPWLINVFRSPATALEMCYGAGVDLHGNWVRPVPEDDPIDYFVRNDPTFIYNRERQLYVANLAANLRDVAFDSGTKKKIVDFGAGRLAWMRYHGFDAQPNLIEVRAYDRDPSIKPEELFPGEDLSSLGIYYKHGDLMIQVKNPDCNNADLVILGGVASYVPVEIFSRSIIKEAYSLLNPDGILFFDLQVKCLYLERSMSIFDWPAMRLADDVPTLIQQVEEMRKYLWKKDIKFSGEYAVDTYNENPSAVMIMLQKV